MNRPLALEKAVAVSFALHLVFFALASFLPQMALFREEQVYTVQLISVPEPAIMEKPAAPSRPEPKQSAAPPLAPKPTRTEAARKEPSGKIPEKGTAAYRAAKERKIQDLREEQERRLESERAEERIREIREAARLDELKRHAEESAPSAAKSRPDAKTKTQNGYTQQVEALIKRNWLYTLTTEERQLVTEISITVLRDGSIKINRIEKPSGNRAFDLSALKALRKTRGVEPPPGGREMEIILRFTPDEE